MDIREQLEKVKWVDLGLLSETLWASEDVIIPEGMTADEVERQFGEFVPSIEMIFELYHATEWVERPRYSRKGRRNGYDVTGKNGKSLVMDVFSDQGEMSVAKGGMAYRFYSSDRANRTLPLYERDRDSESRFNEGLRYMRFRPVKVRKDVLFTFGGPYFVQRRNYEYEGSQITELVFNCFRFDYSELEKRIGRDPSPFEISSGYFQDQYLQYFFKDRLVPVHFLDCDFYVRLVRLDKGWFYGSESYGQEIAELLTRYFGVYVRLVKDRWSIKDGLAVCYETGSRFKYVYDPKEFRGVSPSVILWNGSCSLHPYGVVKYPWYEEDSRKSREDIVKYGVHCEGCPNFVGWKDPDHVECSLPGFAWPDGK